MKTSPGNGMPHDPETNSFVSVPLEPGTAREDGAVSRMEPELGIAVYEPIPDLDEDRLAKWREIRDSAGVSRCRGGLYYLMAGWSYREAAKAVGVTHKSLHTWVQNRGLMGLVCSKDRLTRGWRQVQLAAIEEITDRLTDPEKLANERTKDLAVTAAIATDKEMVLTGGADASSAADAMRSVLAEMGKHGLELTVSVKPTDPGEGPAEPVTIEAEGVRE